ncbi:hypothetical protein Trco_002448 [Trichoderma cornu-damae]|uniref:Ankyrin n=1 Tax=Trichoderma cornu-damae TaxID=654480 RepID=A0A9P8QV09_9HYPO|nr:hypothetical protein Trco_002448 [Trichoderma cornu-damae]
MLPQRGVYADGEDDGYGRDAFPSDLQFNTAAATRIQQPEKPRTNSYHADNSERDDDCPRSQSQSPVSSRGRDDPDRGANGYLWYGDDHSVSTDESQERPHPSQPSSNMNKTRPRSDNGSQRQRSADTNWNNESTSLSKTREYLSQAFFSAVKNADIPAIKRLLDNGADLEMLDRFGRTPLWCAAEMGRRDVIQLLLDEHADTEAQNAHGQTILAWAVENHRNEIIDMLGFS